MCTTHRGLYYYIMSESRVNLLAAAIEEVTL